MLVKAWNMCERILVKQLYLIQMLMVYITHKNGKFGYGYCRFINIVI